MKPPAVLILVGLLLAGIWIPAVATGFPSILPELILCSFVAFVVTGIGGAIRRPRLRPDIDKIWATTAILGFIVGSFYLPTLIWFFPAPSYYGQVFSFNTSKVDVGVNFVSNGPMAAGNRIYPYLVNLFAWCPPWNITSFSISIRGDNWPAVGFIALGPFVVEAPKCGDGPELTFFE